MTDGSDILTRPVSGVVVVRPDTEVMGRQALPYFVGISAASAGATAIWVNLVIVPPRGAAEPHAHRGFETAVYLVSGSVEVRSTVPRRKIACPVRGSSHHAICPARVPFEESV